MKRGAYVSTQTKKKTKASKECELGKDCPYKNELQHRMEFSHNLDSKDIQKEKSFASRGVKLGGSNSGPSRLIQHQSGISNDSLTSFGVRLGGTSSGTSRLVQQTFDQHYSLQAAYGDSHGSSDIFCEICFKFIHPNAFDSHSSSHQKSQRESERANQDLEYENSLLADIQRKDEQDAVEKKKKDELIKQEEEAALREALEQSKQLSEVKALQSAIDNLLPEPDSSYNGTTVRIRITSPTGSKFVRVFRCGNSVQNMFDYLKSIEECRPFLKHVLRDAVGSVTIKCNRDSRTFTEANLVGNCSLLLAPDESLESDDKSSESNACSLSQSSTTTKAVSVPEVIEIVDEFPTRVMYNCIIDLT